MILEQEESQHGLSTYRLAKQESQGVRITNKVICLLICCQLHIGKLKARCGGQRLHMGPEHHASERGASYIVVFNVANVELGSCHSLKKP